ncbi:conserved hypothetical protein [Pediculus humanus corporis]|uniref:Uncharacterized protein n=1 Tax=Pediculus humanus subsp. corporis TaxID=121224 RepID=E0VNE3_PEDHC|nr:uncharacterized protein Phum_PHUM626380 [Pediculus humanus corporis]EEB14899.1 conserved hypothetical protein [Pediculus humanus corporis]
MLSPEIWDFPVLTPQIRNSYCNSDEEIFSKIKKQLFNHHISVTLPNTLTAPNELIYSLTEDCQYYRINAVPVSEIFNKNFIDLFIVKGSLTLISINTLSDQDDRLAFISSGKLILTLSKKSSEEIGIDSTLKNVTKNKHNLYIKTCPSSIALYFCKKGYKVTTCNIDVKKKLNYNVQVPIYDEETDPDSLLEWLGAFNLQCNIKIVDEKIFNWIGLVINGFTGSLLSHKNNLTFTLVEDHYHAFIFKSDKPTLTQFFSVMEN